MSDAGPPPVRWPEPPSLAVRGLVKRYGAGVLALDGVSLELDGGATLALVGESGSGKTTLLRCFNRMVEPDEGVVTIAGRDVRDADPVALRRRIGYVQQEGGLLPHWTVQRNVGLVPWLRGRPAPEAVSESLRLVGLPPETFAARWPRELSGGQRQRVAIARALAARPGLLLLDEPFGALDAITRSELQEAFATLRRDLAMTVVLVTHDLREALLLADRVAVLRGGRIEQLATSAELTAAPATEYVVRLLSRAGVTP